jgi:hypothetical protein
MKTIESQIQINCVKWFRLTHPEPKYLIFAVPNGGNRNAITGAILKAEGVRSVVPDLIIMSAGVILFVEMKQPKGTQNPNQKDFQKIVEGMGFKYFICKSFDEFTNICKKELI